MNESHLELMHAFAESALIKRTPGNDALFAPLMEHGMVHPTLSGWWKLTELGRHTLTEHLGRRPPNGEKLQERRGPKDS
jgi:hypothetical protein